MGTAGSERQGKESKGTEWRMQSGGERLGRAGIEVAGVERRGRQGQVRRKMEWSVEVRGMEGSGTVGIMEARQARHDKARSGGYGLEARDRARKSRRGASR